MKKKKLLWLMPFLAAWLALLPACFKAKLDPPDPGTVLQEWDTLSAITQERKHTFGCLVNGKVWVPHGINLMGGIKNMHLDE